MKIAFVISIRQWAGVKTWMLEFGSALQSMGHEIIFYSRDSRLTLEARKNNCRAYTLRFGADYNPLTTYFFYKSFQQHGIQITCMNVQKELRTAGIAAKLLKIPVVQRIGLPSDINHRLDQRFSQRFLVDHILVTSKWMKSATHALNPKIPKNKFQVIYNAKRVTTPSKALKKSPVRFAITSRLALEKGHDHLIKACHILKQEGISDYRCDIYGAGDQKPQLQQYVNQTDLNRVITFKGFSRNLEEQLLQYDFGILTSKHEGLANTVLEYMAAALPCITTRGGAITEIVKHHFNGLLYDYADAQTLAKHMKMCITMDLAQYTKLSANANRTVTQKFNREINVSRLEQYFQLLIDREKQKIPLPDYRIPTEPNREKYQDSTQPSPITPDFLTHKSPNVI